MTTTVCVPRWVSTTAVLAALLAAVLGAGVGCADGDESPARTAEEEKYWGDPGGRWHEGGWRELSRDDEMSVTDEQQREIDRLLSIGYLAGSTAPPANEGVTIYDKKSALDGYNFYTAGHLPGALLMDMRGTKVYKWEHRFIDAWDRFPGDALPKNNKSVGYWRRAHLLPSGDVIAIFEGVGIIKVDRRSNLLWANFNSAHHDLEVMDDGRIYTLTRKAHMIPRINDEHPILEDFIILLDSKGNEIHSFSVLEAFEDSPYAPAIEEMADRGDIFHTNTIEILDATLAGRVPGFDEGNALISLREVGVIAVVDMKTERVVWALKGTWEAQHQPTVLPDGNVMLFDNRGYRGFSRVIAFDPASLETSWIYKGAAPNSFFSRECGSNQYLPNGNILITESDRGKAFELSPELTIVWKYINTAQVGDNNEFISSIFEMIRVEPDYVEGWLGKRR